MAAITVAIPVCLIAELLPIKSYSTADGLASNSISQVVADSRGFVWFCTPEGLSRFDGYRFVNFGMAEGLPHQSVDALLETRAGEYVAATQRGLSIFHGENGGKFTTYLPGGNADENAVNALLQDSRGRIWCGTRAGLFELVRGYRFRREWLPPIPGQGRIPVTSLMEDAGHRLWVGTRLGVYVIGSDGAAQHIAMPGTTRNVRALLQDRDGGIWAGLQDGLVFMRDADNRGRYGVQQIYKEAGEVKGLDVTSLAEGPDGSLWAGASAGIVRWLPGSGRPALRMLTRAQGLIDRQVNALASDRAGNMWVGTEAAGAMRVQQAGFTTYREQDGLGTDRVWSVLAGRGGTIRAVTASEGDGDVLNLFDGARFHASIVPGFSKQASWGHRVLLQARTGAWWAATTAGLCTYAATPEATPPGQPEACYARGLAILQVFEDSKGSIWATSQVLPAGDVGILRWDPATRAVSFVKGGPSEKELVTAFAEDRERNIWMALANDLFRYDGRKFTRFTRQDGVPAGIGDLFVDQGGRLWIASANGLGRIDRPGEPHPGSRIYKTSDGLSSDAIVCVTEDATGRIYAATVKGVDRLDPRTGSIRHSSVADGLARGNITTASRDGAGDLWFATTQGLSRLSPTLDRPPAIPSVRITDLRIGRERYPVSQLGETHIRRGDLQPSQNQFQVAFVGFSDEPEANLRYTYTLEGGESGWQRLGREHEANYPGLEPGHYRFLAKAVNSEGRESETPAEIDFAILPPVWARWWFETLALAAAACTVFVAYRRRLQGITARVKLLYEERLDERARIARELHDTLLQSLAGVSLQLDGVAKQIGPSSEAAASRIKAVRRQVDDSFREARQKVLDLRSPMLQGRALPAVLRESLEQIAAGHPERLRVTVTGQPRALREEVDETVLRIGQEAVANALRHARASEIEVSLAYEDRALGLRVKDDGLGFDPDEASRRMGHWGLRNMQERAHRIGAKWQLSSAAGHGTEIEVIVPLPAVQ